jgi:prepilin-type processing-associated H-X9-DG protein
MRLSHDRPGHTLVEKLVVIAIIGVLIGLLLPAVQKVREAAHRARCMNNLRQIGLALHEYHDAAGSLPPGVHLPFPDQANAYLVMPWHAVILPYIEQQSLWDRTWQAWIAEHRLLETPQHWENNAFIVPVFLCPSEAKKEYRWGPAYAAGLTSYLGVCGPTTDGRKGVLFYDSHIRVTDVTDGTSQTLMVGERPPNIPMMVGRWYGGWGQNQEGRATNLLGTREIAWYDNICERGPYSYGPGKADNPCDAFHYWSHHSGGANFCFADGSVKFIPYSAAPLMRALATRAGGEVVDLP